MKKIILVCLMALVGFGVSTAQKQAGKKSLATAVFTSQDIDCDHCVKKIMENVSVLGKGVKDVKTDVKKREVTVVFDPAKNDVERIAKGLESLNLKVVVVPIPVSKGDLENAKGLVVTAPKEQGAGDVVAFKGNACPKAGECAGKAACCKECPQKEACKEAGKCVGKPCGMAAKCCETKSCDKVATCDKTGKCTGKPCGTAAKCDPAKAQKGCCPGPGPAKK